MARGPSRSENQVIVFSKSDPGPIDSELVLPCPKEWKLLLWSHIFLVSVLLAQSDR